MKKNFKEEVLKIKNNLLKYNIKDKLIKLNHNYKEKYYISDLLVLVTDLDNGKTQSTINKFKAKSIKSNELNKIFNDMKRVFKQYKVYDKFEPLIPKIKTIINNRKNIKFDLNEYGKKLYNYIKNNGDIEYDSFISLKKIKLVVGSSEYSKFDKDIILKIKEKFKNKSFLKQHNLKIDTNGKEKLWRIYI